MTHDHRTPSLIVPLPEESLPRRGWKLVVDGVELREVRHMVLAHREYGAVAYGLTPGGYDGWAFREPAGGGVVIVPFVVMSGELLVGVVEQARPLQGGMVLNAPRGFVHYEERHLDGARRELAEETGLELSNDDLVRLPGSPANPNSAFFETGAGGGVEFFAAPLSPGMLAAGAGGWRLAADLASNARRSSEQQAEKIEGLRFVPWTEAATLGDMFTNAAVARLLAWRHQEGSSP